VVRRSATHVPVAQGAPPSAHPIWSETNVTEFGWKPDGTVPDTGVGVAAGDGDGDGGRVGAGLMTPAGEVLGLFEVFAGVAEHAASRTQETAAATTTRG
jgi:hypothetical protein